MNERNAINEDETAARMRLTEALRAMLDKELPFFEGARLVVALREKVGGVSERDPDFDAFLVIYSETDHLPYKEHQHLWNADALAKLAPEFEKTETWASSFAPAACESLIARFGQAAL